MTNINTEHQFGFDNTCGDRDQYFGGTVVYEIDYNGQLDNWTVFGCDQNGGEHCLGQVELSSIGLNEQDLLDQYVTSQEEDDSEYDPMEHDEELKELFDN